ncbi:MAG TPA: tRNA (adenosine(37)-N6)-threonylcarbamoyltransferase complex ATPase subunit type 1 TsaE [Catenuloplanes sp.]
MDSFSVVSSGPRETANIASILAPRLAPGDVVLLTGDLAAGKTTFVKGVAAALGSTEVVTSPTFTLAQFYPTGRAPVMHVDTYRLTGIEEYRDLGLDEYYESSISLIEWGDKVAGDVGCPLTIRFARPSAGPGGPVAGTDVRTLTFSSSCERWTAILENLHGALLETVA